MSFLIHSKPSEALPKCIVVESSSSWWVLLAGLFVGGVGNFFAERVLFAVLFSEGNIRQQFCMQSRRSALQNACPDPTLEISLGIYSIKLIRLHLHH